MNDTQTIRASVAMAVYNGEKYLSEQIDSILNMLSKDDELVISYDESDDKSLNIIKSYESKDQRVKIVYDDGKSVESNFNNAVKNCQGEFIFLADQDDVWINDKVNTMVNYFKKNPDVVVLISDGIQVDSKLNKINELFEVYHTSPNPIRNLFKGTYLGCQMAFRASIKNKVWPVRVQPPLPHDLWLGVCGARYGRILLMKDKLILHRLHEENYSNTSKMNVCKVILNRFYFLWELCRALMKRK